MSVLINEIGANVIKIIHVVLIIFIVSVPFVPDISWSVLAIHVMGVISLMVHWGLNQDTCFLTLLEATLRGVSDDKTFMYRIVSPVYKIQDADLKRWVFYITPILGLISGYRIFKRWDEVKRDVGIAWSGTLKSNKQFVGKQTATSGRTDNSRTNVNRTPDDTFLGDNYTDQDDGGVSDDYNYDFMNRQ